MSSLFEILDFSNDFFGQSDRKQEKLKRRNFINQDVDYYKQGLDSTGIKVSDPERWSDIDDDDEDKKRDVDISQVGSGDDNQQSNTDISNLSSGIDNALSSSSSLNNINASFIDYNTSLQNAGFKDRSQSFLSQQFGISLASTPQSAKEAKQDVVGSFTTEKGRQSLAMSAAKKGLGLLGFNPIATGLASGFVTGKTVQDPLGQPSYRPDHAVLGTVMDINFSIQSNNISQSIAAMNANNLTGYGGQKSPTGFFGYIGGQLVSRAPLGKTFTGTTNLDINQLTALEAITKGFAPLGYNTTTETGTNSMAVTTGFGRGYDQRGYMQSISGTSPAGSMKDVAFTAAQYGISQKDVLDSLKDVRSNITFFGSVKDSTKPTLAQALAEKATAKSDKKAGIYSTPGSQLGSAAGAVGSSGNLGGPTGAGYQNTDNDPSDNNNTGSGLNDSSGVDNDEQSDNFGGGWTAKGGLISKGNNFALGGKGEVEPAGFIEGPPENYSDETTIADDIPLTVKDGTFVINAPAVENEGSPSIQKMLAEGYKKAMTRDIGVDKNFKIGKIPSREELDIQISRGEVVVPPHVARVIGYDKLEKINNRGKREVERRQKAGNQEKVQAGQGFAATGGNQKIKIFRGEPYPEQISEFDKKYMSGRRMTGAWFSSNKNYAKNYGQLQKTLDVTFDEYAKGARKAELYRNIAQMQSDSFSDKDYREKKGVLHLTKKQRQQLFKHVKEIKQFAKMVQDGKADPSRFVNTLHMSIFPDKKEQATIRKIESYKNNPKLFAKFVVRGLANNIVNKGIPFASKAIPGIGALAGFSPKEMGDATLSGKEGFIYDYNPIKNSSATQ